MGVRKGKEVEDNFNLNKKGVMGARELKKRMADLADAIAAKKEVEGPEILEENDDLEAIDGEDLKSTYKLVEEMRAVYKAAGGKKKLIKLLKADDKALIALVKELMKIEASLLAAKMRMKENGGGSDGRATFVILKGLQDETEVIKNSDKMLNLEQITDAINPSAVPRETYEEDIERPE